MRKLSVKLMKSRFAALMGLCVMFAQCLPVTANELVPENLNLSSTQRTVVAPQGTPNTSINIGGQNRAVGAGSSLTAAEAVAVQQLVNRGAQSLFLGANGNAVGGRVIMNTGDVVSSMTIPRSVSVVRDFATTGNLNLTGNIINAGTIHAVSTNSAINTALITANNITNLVTGHITSVLPSGGIAGFGSAISNLNLSISALGKLINYGTISSAGDLNISAVSGLHNVSTGPETKAVLSGAGAVNIFASSIFNSGLVSAGTNINVVQSILNRDLAINNKGGIFEALSGVITFNNTGAGAANTLLFEGGSLLSQVLNVDGGKGKINFTADTVSGLMNVNACGGIFGAHDSLNIGNVNIAGDPTIWSLGDLNIAGLELYGEAITYIAGGDINIADLTIIQSNYHSIKRQRQHRR
jgi:hypothetical protein